MTSCIGYAGRSITGGGATHIAQVLSKLTDKERHPGTPGWGLGVELTSPPRKNSVVSEHQWRDGHGTETYRSAVEEEEEEEEEEEGGGGGA